MRILINCSNLVVGGGIQVAASIITELIKNDKHFFSVVLSQEVSKQIDTKLFPGNFKFYNLGTSPAGLLSRKILCNKLDQIEVDEYIHFVLTIFGPSYWKPKKAKHLCGFALPWMIYPKSVAFKKLNFNEKIKTKLRNWYKLYHFKKECDYFWCETEIVRERMIKHLGLSHIYVVGNSVSHHFTELDKKSDLNLGNEFFKILTVSAYYTHKNLEIIKGIVPFISTSKLKIKFYLTLPDSIFSKLFNTSEQLKYVENLGVISNKDCPKYYNSVDAVFVPTLLECFSANYVEAMSTNNPIIASDFDFSRSICEDAAVYFNAEVPKDAYEKILSIIDDRDKQQKMVIRGRELLGKQKSSEQRANELIYICEANYKN
jgi:glycosyltransferase involved in cell wall biosynthesis